MAHLICDLVFAQMRCSVWVVTDQSELRVWLQQLPLARGRDANEPLKLLGYVGPATLLDNAVFAKNGLHEGSSLQVAFEEICAQCEALRITTIVIVSSMSCHVVGIGPGEAAASVPSSTPA